MFESLKEGFKKKIEDKAIKSTLVNPKTNQEEIVYLRYGGLISDWGRVYPVVNEDGSWNLTNLIFGGKKNLIRLAILLGLIALALWGVYDMVHSTKLLLNTPCIQSCINPIN